MRHNMRTGGFTLIELIIVIVIIGVLASIAAPMMQGMKAKAICAEAVTGLSALRSSVRQYIAEYGSYPTDIHNVTPGQIFDAGRSDCLPGLTLTSITYTGGSSLDGTYVSQQCYVVVCVGGDTDFVSCWFNGDAAHNPPNQNKAPKHDEAAAINRSAATESDRDHPEILMRLKSGRIESNIPSAGFPALGTPYQ